jgi:signal transduction histidine kinase
VYKDPSQTTNSPLDLVVDPPMSRAQVLRISLVGFGLVVGLVLLAAYLGYRGSDNIQDTAQAISRENFIRTGVGSTLEAKIVKESQELLDQLAWVLGLCFLLAAGTAGMSVWIIQRAFAKLEWQAAELAHVSWHMIDGHEKMARRFSHEMHDELGQSLSGLRRMLTRADANEFGTMRQQFVEIVDEVLQDVRKLSQVLRPVILDDFGLDPGLRWLCERFTQRTQIPVHFESNLKSRLAESLETHLFRLTQEALTNIARHSGATKAWVELLVSERNVILIITDNGHGLDPSTERKSPSLGMVGMRARARQIDGELVIENGKEGGLRIHVEAPLVQAEADVEQEDSSFVG